MKTTEIKCNYCQSLSQKSIYEVARSQKLGKPMYCSLSCANAYVRVQVGIKSIETYNREPSKCQCCDTNLSYELRRNKFCSSSCSAKVNNKLFPKRVKMVVDKITKVVVYVTKPKPICEMCDKPCNLSKNRFCSEQCSADFRKRSVVEKFKRGEKVGIRSIRNYLIEIRGEKCEECGWDKKNTITNTVPLDMDHVDGNHENNLLTNLRLLCPCCHSLTSTYKNLNKGRGRADRLKRYHAGKSF